MANSNKPPTKSENARRAKQLARQLERAKNRDPVKAMKRNSRMLMKEWERLHGKP